MLNVLDFIASADVHCHINQVVPKRDCLCKVTNVTIAGGFCPNLEKSTGDVSKLISCDPIITKKKSLNLCAFTHILGIFSHYLELLLALMGLPIPRVLT